MHHLKSRVKKIDFNLIVWIVFVFLFLLIVSLILIYAVTRNFNTSNGDDKECVPDYPAFPFENGWTRSKLREFNRTNGHFPSPFAYLKTNYIRRHLSLFDAGASLLIPEDDLERMGRDFIGEKDNTTFVATKVDMDEILKKANGSMAVVEEELGIPAGEWKGKDIRRIDVENPRKLNLRIPTGNEIGANELWLPGGYLPTGIPEAVTNSIPKDMYNETKVELK
ncbi:hypothetical protein Ddc_13258 [Ditylenchus destructor]|nr:hypothetical protein Ddc_13258 [Ditylenchus destructor]